MLRGEDLFKQRAELNLAPGDYEGLKKLALERAAAGRKIKIAASLLGLDKDITVETADTNDPADTLRVQNPLGKIPILVLADGLTLLDSRVIMEYLDASAAIRRLAGSGSIDR